ncbi:hypothetical protein JD969_02080 [Planctomycetota bacterium]|nr:hypothetical protein JD969_02080 [Planctomycetota bacterium]
MKVFDWTLKGAEGETIYGNTHLPEGDAKGVVILSHGFKGYKDYGFFPRLADSFAKSGLIAHRFNFSHSGMTNRIETFERKDLFNKDTCGKQIFDLKEVIAAVDRGELEGRGKNLVLFGHSRGGVMTLLTMGKLIREMDVLGGVVNGVVTAASPSSAFHFSEADKEALRKDGRLLSPSGRTGEDLYVGLGWLEEIENDPVTYDVLEAIEVIECPVCVVHGNDDPTVPVAHAHKLVKASGDNATCVIIPKANHVFNAPNPLGLDETMPGETKAFIDSVVRFTESRC